MGLSNLDSSISQTILRYVGIWYANISMPTYIWIDNRDNPIKDSSGVLKIGNSGNLTLFDRDGKIVWSVGRSSANSTATQSNNGTYLGHTQS
ncbi:G-type lectin S-receptor-like serine/threonine-protein kinase RKS1 [Acorus gramineus]|uniref:G-type lectin S-receptor-like serine/threonine-protein kinase RKS1 n=1 Tax=Acorus gramineus TaxID=55184 RepID=A0AAV9BWQ0_ACOGR|nr:G-type lectin S-receptor-like serine/threonine-protein kinase RKS1 [Acorus gramineus]